jgi:hypothetical protein
MAHAQKPDFVFRPNGRVHLNRSAEASVQSTTGSRGVRISGSNTGYTMFRGSVKGTGYPLHPPVSPSLPLLCVTLCHHISNAVYPLFVHNTHTHNTKIILNNGDKTCCTRLADTLHMKQAYEILIALNCCLIHAVPRLIIWKCWSLVISFWNKCEQTFF